MLEFLGKFQMPNQITAWQINHLASPWLFYGCTVKQQVNVYVWSSSPERALKCFSPLSFGSSASHPSMLFGHVIHYQLAPAEKPSMQNSGRKNNICPFCHPRECDKERNNHTKECLAILHSKTAKARPSTTTSFHAVWASGLFLTTPAYIYMPVSVIWLSCSSVWIKFEDKHRRRKHGGSGGFRPQTLKVMGALPP